MAAPRDIPIRARVTADVTEVRRLTGGDAAVVIALLLFILAWGAGFCVLWEMADGDTADIGTWDAVVLLWLAGGPMLWAAGLVKAIVSDSTKRARPTRGVD